MERLSYKLMICWMIATVAHLPLPVCDGDNLGSKCLPPHVAGTGSKSIDIDFILLGCDHPDDPDDGPIDDDPEGTDFAAGPFPLYVGSLSAACPLVGNSEVELPRPFDPPPAFLAAVSDCGTILGSSIASFSPGARVSLDVGSLMRC